MGDLSSAFPAGWKWARLGDLCIKTELVNPGKQPDEPFKYVDVSGVSNESYRIVEAKDLLGKDAPSRARKTIRADDVIFATVRPTLKRVAIVPPELDGQVCSTGYCVLRADRSVLEPSFLYFHLLTDGVTATVEYLQKGATYPAINDSDLSGLSLLLPPISEQRAIAHTLRTVRQSKDTRQRELTLERERKAALMEHLFTHGTRGEPRKQTEIGMMPESWQVVKVGAVLTLQRGFDLPEQERRPGLIPIVSSSGTFRTHAVAKAKGPGVVTGRYGTLGEVFYIESDYWPLNTTLFVKDFKGNYPLFISYFLETIGLKTFNDKTSVPGINRNHVHNAVVGFPPLEEQYVIAVALRSCDTKIATLEREISGLNELFSALLDGLMTGGFSTTLQIGEDEK